MPERYIKSDPYPWPYNGDLQPQNTALVIIDMQTDFCGIGGYVDKMGYDLSLTRAPIEPIKRLLAVAADRRRHRRSRPLRAHSGSRRARLGYHFRSRAGARRADHRQAWQGLVLRH
jgi:hypothetical protein